MTPHPQPLTVIPTFIGGGAALKIADHTGENPHSTIGYLSATIAGLLLGSLISYGPEESSIVIGLTVGVALARKIDRPNLLLGLTITVTAASVLGFKMPIIWLTTLVSTLSLLDEIGHDRLGTRSGPLGLFFRYRGTLKTALLIAAATSKTSTTTAVGFLGFDAGYDTVNWLLSLRTRNKTI